MLLYLPLYDGQITTLDAESLTIINVEILDRAFGNNSMRVQGANMLIMLTNYADLRGVFSSQIV